MTPVIMPKVIAAGSDPDIKIYDVEIKHLGGYSYKCIAKTSNGDKRVEVPCVADKPTDMDLQVWVSRLSKEEVLAAAKVYTDIWTWHDASEHYRSMMELFVQFIEQKRPHIQPHDEHTMRYNLDTQYMEIIEQGQWVVITS